MSGVEREYLSLRQAAHYLGVRPDFILDARRQNLIEPRVPVGREPTPKNKRWKRSDLDALMVPEGLK